MAREAVKLFVEMYAFSRGDLSWKTLREEEPD
jgi:hypothetical protein